MKDKKPLLIFPNPTLSGRTKNTQPPPNVKFPDPNQQKQRLGPRWVELEKAIVNQTISLGPSPLGTFSELILVFELVGSIDGFFRAVDKIPEMHFLKEYETQFEQDDYFESEDGKAIPGRVFVSLTNQRSLQELFRLWKIFKLPEDKQHYDKGLTKFKNLFLQLRDVRPYSFLDRIRDTGLEEYIKEQKELRHERVKFEIEFAYPLSEPKRIKGIKEVKRLLEENDGFVLEGSIVTVKNIRYCACIAEAPMSVFDDLTENNSVKFLKASQVMFFRPIGQIISTEIESVDGVEELSEISEETELFGSPVIALLDGMPLSNHSILEGKLIVDDPDNFGEGYDPKNRRHGTSMASLILHGDLSSEKNKLVRPIYIRPVMKANSMGQEHLPEDRLPIDIFHRAVRRMFEGENGEPPTAPTVKIINVSIGDFYRPYLLEISTWAKLLDWLSWKYKVLFIVSAGNVNEDIHLPIPYEEFDETDADTIQQSLLKVLVDNNFNRKILTPSEGFNVLSVGSLHYDSSNVDFSAPQYLQKRNLCTLPTIVSPHSRFGLGHNKSIKPEILMPGGRTLFRKSPIQRETSKTVFKMDPGGWTVPPGNKVAWPGIPGNRNNLVYTCGTSNAAALTSNLAGQLYEVLLELNEAVIDAQNIDLEFFPVLIKSLLVHGSSWGSEADLLREIIKDMPGVPANGVKRRISSFLGYGGVNGERVLYCTQHRVTLIGTGILCSKEGENAHEFRFPLPSSISQKVVRKKLVTTLAWFSPVNVTSIKYRQAHLYMENLMNNEFLNMDGQRYDLKLSSKGTVQHQILEGESADVLIEDDHLIIKVNCRQDAPELKEWEKIPYALAVTLEIPESLEVNIYEEIRERIQGRVKPRSGV